jgi:pyruvate-ferredoxin/flavodoxin oxidoreductase
MSRPLSIMDGNEAAAHVAYRTSEVIAIYPITPSTTMGELSDAWAAAGVKNIWGTVPTVQEMQSEGGAAGAIHGALQTGALSTTFTASQGLLLMIPNMYKIAGELTSTVFHVTARAIATHGLSIFGDHSDVMAARSTGWAVLFSGSVQEAMDMALISQAATFKGRVPFIHAFDGFRTSHELNKVEVIGDDTIMAMIDADRVRAHRLRGLTPDHPFIRGTAQNPDVFFQSRETVNPYYMRLPLVVQEAMDKFFALTGRQYKLFDYVGAPDAERVVILMGSGAETVEETCRELNARGEKVGVVKVRLFRPFSAERLLTALPSSVKAIAVLDRCKEPGALGEPLYQDVATSLASCWSRGLSPFAAFPKLVGGRYGLGSKEFTPGMAKAVFDELKKPIPKNAFTVGIHDNVGHTSLDWDPDFDLERKDTVRATFWGLGADGTVGANKNSAKIIGEETDGFAQGYFVYDSKKSGSLTISHLRFGPTPIHSPYLITRATFTACHQFSFLGTFPVLDALEAGGTFLLNSPFGPEEVWSHLPVDVRSQIREKRLAFHVVDAFALSSSLGLGRRINTIMQACFFALSGVLPREEATAKIKDAIRKTYGKRGESVINKNLEAVDRALDGLRQVNVPAEDSDLRVPARAPGDRPTLGEDPFVRRVTLELIKGKGEDLPVGVFPTDGTYPTATSRLEKRDIALDVPVWSPDACIQCGKCVMVCPHAAIRSKVFAPETANAPAGFQSLKAKWANVKDKNYTLQVSTRDCTGCTLCVEICPAPDKENPGKKALNMVAKGESDPRQDEWWDAFLRLPDITQLDPEFKFSTVKDVQLLRPLFEFSGACSGCGETPYLKLLSQLYGDRLLIANATGCSSIFGGNLPTTPWAKDVHGRGPAWSNSLFEDNAEFGLGMRLSVEKRAQFARQLVADHREVIGAELADELLQPESTSPEDIERQRRRVDRLRVALADRTEPALRDLIALADALVAKTVWIVGGDGWAYDIGYGGLDHVIASGQKVRILVLDTEVYSNTGGQASKSTPRAAVARFAAGGKKSGKKDLGLMAMNYGNVYVASVSMGANDMQTLKAFREAEQHDGPSIIIAYAHCIAHGMEMGDGLRHQKSAVDSGHWLLYRYNPALAAEGKSPLQLDCKEPKMPLKDFYYSEDRYKVLVKSDPTAAASLMEQAEGDAQRRWAMYKMLAEATPAAKAHGAAEAKPGGAEPTANGGAPA